MSAQDVFYVLGGMLVLAAVVLSALGLRSERFPGGRALQGGVIAAVSALVVATAAFAWVSAEEEQDHREAELAEAAAEGEQGTPAEAEADSEQDATTTIDDETASADGAALYTELGCGGCHTLEDAGSDGQTGPPLDSTLQDQDAAYIETAIVDPNQDVVEGYPPDVMPQTYDQQLEDDELEALVQYLVEATGAQG